MHTVGPVIIAWFNYCVLPFASEIANLVIVFAAHEARKWAISRIQVGTVDREGWQVKILRSIHLTWKVLYEAIMFANEYGLLFWVRGYL